MPLRVFLSSTTSDLQEHRAAVDDTLLRMQAQSVVMERFGPVGDTPVSECERRAAACDVLICIVAFRNGHVPEVGRGSITRREVEAAQRAGRQVLVWLADESRPWLHHKEQDRLQDPDVLSSPERTSEVIGAVRQLVEFKGWLKREFVCEYFSSAEDLARKVAVAVNNLPRAQAASEARRYQPEFRIVHALQRAPGFFGRSEQLGWLSGWIADEQPGPRVCAIVAPGGTGKTALLDATLEFARQKTMNALVWSFYERPDCESFLMECAGFMLGDDATSQPLGRLERLLRALRSGPRTLLVLDGLERVQAEGSSRRVQGELEDQQLKLLLQALCVDGANAKVIVTSRFSLVDLVPWEGSGYHKMVLPDLDTPSAVQLLRHWNVAGPDVRLSRVCESVGNHALTVAVLGSFLKHYADGGVSAVRSFHLDKIRGINASASKLSRILTEYATKLPGAEKDLLSRLSLFPRGVTKKLLVSVFGQAPARLSGNLAGRQHDFLLYLNNLSDKGLVFSYHDSDGERTWTAHPFLRDFFAQIIDCPANEIHYLVVQSVSVGLSQKPSMPPLDRGQLDRYETLLEATVMSGKLGQAVDLYFNALGGYKHLATKAGEYIRGHRVTGLLMTAIDLDAREPSSIKPDQVWQLWNDHALFAQALGKLAVACHVWEEIKIALDASLSGDSRYLTRHNLTDCMLALGQTTEALATIAEGSVLLEQEEKILAINNARLKAQGRRILRSGLQPARRKHLLAYAAWARHLEGQAALAKELFDDALDSGTELGVLYSIPGLLHCQYLLDTGQVSRCAKAKATGYSTAVQNGWQDEHPHWLYVQARLVLLSGGDPRTELDRIRQLTSYSGDIEAIIHGHRIAAMSLLASGSLDAALTACELGLLQARTCGYRRHHVDLAVLASQICRRHEAPLKAADFAKQAEELSLHSSNVLAWGLADAWHVKAEALTLLGDLEGALQAATAAGEQRRLIRHPGAPDSDRLRSELCQQLEQGGATLGGAE